MQNKILPRDAGLAMAKLMPRVIQGIQLEFFVTRRVTQTQFLMLLAVHGYGQCTMGTLAKNMHVRMPTATGVVSRLVRAGLIRRQAKPEDRRQVLVSLTPKGHAFIQAFQGIVRHRWEEVLQSLGPEELATFHRVITRLEGQLRLRQQPLGVS